MYLLSVTPPGGEGAGPGAGDRELAFGNVDIVPEKGEEKQNVGEMVVARGYAQVWVRGLKGLALPLLCNLQPAVCGYYPQPTQVVRHRSDEERSSVYDKLLECEELAKGAKRGIHSAKEPAPNRVNDVSQPGSVNK